jgi:hypothetical protein
MQGRGLNNSLLTENRHIWHQNWLLLSFFQTLPGFFPLVSFFARIKTEKKICLIDKENQMGRGAMSYMRKGFLIYEEMRKYLTKYEEAVSHI